jgi:hypothetical protein
VALEGVPRIVSALACLCGLWLGCADVHEDAADVATDAAAGDVPASGPVVVPGGEGDVVDVPSSRCMRDVFDPSDQPDDAAACTYQIDKGVVDPLYLVVVIEGLVRPANHPDGFLYQQGGVVTLVGDACAAVRDGASVEMHTSCYPVEGARGQPLAEDVVARCQTRTFDPSERPADGASRCTYRVDQRVENPSYIRVIINERPRPRDQASDGWMYQQGGTVVLVGAACEEAERGVSVRIQNECDGFG